MARCESLILVTGGSGFVGRHLVNELSSRGQALRATHRAGVGAATREGVEWIDVGDIAMRTNWSPALRGVTEVIHLAGRAHVLTDAARDSAAAYRETNTDGTVHLAECAAVAGVRRFVFVSSIGIHGQVSPGRPFTERDEPQPHDAYTCSKLAAEYGLLEVGRRTSMQVVIVRPPLVFGPDAPGNFGRLLNLVDRGWPLPFGAIDNRRSLVNVHNLVDFLRLCCERPDIAGETFIVADGKDISTAELIRYLAEGMGRNPRLVPVPEVLLDLTGRITGRRAQIDRLCGSLQVSTAKARDVLGWQPPIGIEEGLVAAAREFSKAQSSLRQS